MTFETWDLTKNSCPEQLNRTHCPSVCLSVTTKQSESSQHYRVNLDTCDLWDIWSEWWGLIEETWPVNFFSAFSQHSFNFHSTFSIFFFNFFTFLSTFSQLFLTFFSNFFSNLCTSIGIWDTADYSTDNWGPGFMTIFVTLQLIVTLDSIRNSCDVFQYSLKETHFWE